MFSSRISQIRKGVNSKNLSVKDKLLRAKQGGQQREDNIKKGLRENWNEKLCVQNFKKWGQPLIWKVTTQTWTIITIAFLPLKYLCYSLYYLNIQCPSQLTSATWNKFLQTGKNCKLPAAMEWGWLCSAALILELLLAE